MRMKMALSSFELKYKICLLKAYFDKGYGLTAMFKYLIVLFGISSLDVSLTMIFGVIYVFFCFLLGFIWYKTNFIRAEAEVGNRFNLFQQEVRDKFGIPNNRKI